MSKSLKKRIQRRLEQESRGTGGGRPVRTDEYRDSRAPATIGVQVFQFKVASDPMPDEAVERLPDSVRERMEDLFELVRSNPASIENEVRQLIRQYPDVICFRNWLCASLRGQGRNDEAREICESLFREQPDYFFARTTLAEIALEEADVETAEQLLSGNAAALLSMYPDREVFHVSEVRLWFFLWGKIELLKGNMEGAGSHRKFLDEMEPDSPAVQELERLMKPENSALLQILAAARRLKAAAGMPGKRPPARRDWSRASLQSAEWRPGGKSV